MPHFTWDFAALYMPFHKDAVPEYDSHVVLVDAIFLEKSFHSSLVPGRARRGRKVCNMQRLHEPNEAPCT